MEIPNPIWVVIAFMGVAKTIQLLMEAVKLMVVTISIDKDMRKGESDE